MNKKLSRKYETFLFVVRVQEIQFDGMAHAARPVDWSNECHFESWSPGGRLKEERLFGS